MTNSPQQGLSIQLFQTFSVTLDGQPVTKFEADTARALLAYLAAQPGALFKREVLAELLWDASDTAAALTNLRSALRRIRTAIDAAGGAQQTPKIDYILSERNMLAFDAAAPAWVDVVEFERLLAAVQQHPHTAVEQCAHCHDLLTAATELYRDAFLPDLAIDTPGFIAWRRGQTERLQRLALTALYTLGEQAFRAGAYGAAETHARRQLAIESWNEEAHRQLMRVLFAGGRRTAALAQFEICRKALAEELGIDPDDETQTLYLRLLAGESPMPRQVGQNPYKGLSPFGPDDADVFFGRAAATQRLHAEIARRRQAVLVGPSGSGKSSVISAGLVPTLLGQRRDGAAPPASVAAQEWQVIFMRPGQEPLAALDAVLVEQPDNRPTLLIVDQFEEIFTVCPDEGVRTAFLARLLTPGAQPALSQPHLLLALRADFMGEALRYAELAELLQHHTILLGPLSGATLRQVIEEPARLRGVAFEPGLVDRLLVDIGDGPGHLPLLQFALTQLWDRQSDGWVTHAAFDAIGGVRGALAGYAEDIFNGLTPEQQEQARLVFLTLVQQASDAQDVRRLATRGEIGEENWPLVQHLANARLLVTNHDERTGETAELIHEALIREWQRLQTWLEVDREFQTWRQRTRIALAGWEENPDDEVNLLHGARLLEAERWLDERNTEIAPQIRAFVTASIAARARRAQAESAVRERELATAQSLAEAEHRRAEAAARGRRQLLWLTGVLVLVTVIAVSAALFAFQAQQEANLERANAQATARHALSRQLGAQSINEQASRVDLALLLNLEALSLAEDAADEGEMLLQTDVDPRLRRMLYGVNGAIYGLRLQADGESLLAHNEFGSILQWDGATGQQEALAPSAVDAPQGTVFSPQGSQIATWRDRVVTVRDAETAEPQYQLSVPGSNLYTLAFSTDGSRILSYWEDQQFRLWDGATGALLEEYAMDLADLGVLGVASPDGHVVVLAGEQDNKPLIQLWDIAKGEAVATLEQNHTDEVHQVSISPDGRLLATASYDGSVRLWDTRTGEQQGEPLLGHTGRVLFAAFSPDGQTLVSGGTDEQVILWDIATGQPIGAPLRGHSNEVRAGVFSADGAKLITGDNDGRALVWDVGMTHELGGHDDRVRALLLSPDERTLVSAGFDKQIIVRDATTFAVLKQVATAHENAILNAAFSPDGKTFATVDAGGLLILWDIATWTPRHELRSDVQNQLIGLAFTPDSQEVATGAFNGIVEVHDVAAGELITAPFQAHANGWAMSLLFSPDGKTFYTGSSDQTIQRWDAATFTPLGAPLPGHAGWVTDLTLTPDGSTLVSASADEEIRAWDAVTGAPVGAPLIGHDKQVWSVNFRTVGDRLVLISIGSDGRVIWWDWATRTPLGPPLRTGRESEWMRVSADGRRLLVSSTSPIMQVIEPDLTPWVERACAIANRNLTPEEWDYYMPNLAYQTTCPPPAE